MAGIGFELKKILRGGGLLSVLKVYGYSAFLSAGPWVISIIGIIFVGYINFLYYREWATVSQFLVSITYLIALSLIFTGFLQVSFTRYIADRLFEREDFRVLPNFSGALILVMGLGFIFILPLALYALKEQDTLFVIIFISAFTTLCGMWLSNVLLISLKQYKAIFLLFFFSFALIILLSILFKGLGLSGLMAIFFIGIAVLFWGMLSLIFYNYPSDRLVEFDFLSQEGFYKSFALAGISYNLGIWIDKFIFWFHPLTGHNVIGALRASIFYDVPIFLAYLSIVPGMGVFFYRLEADFAEKYDLFYDAVRKGGTLKLIQQYRDEMVDAIRMAIREVFIIQGIFNIMIFFLAPQIFRFFKIPLFHLPLFYVYTIGTQLQLAFMSVLSILFYLDRRKESVFLTLAFVVLNAILSYTSLKLGYAFFGYGFAISLLIVFIVAVLILRRDMEDLEYETFMRH